MKDKERGGCLMGWCQWAKCVHSHLDELSLGGFTHLETYFGPQFIEGLHHFVLDKKSAVP